MFIRSLPEAALLRKLLRYEPDTGHLFWLPRTADMFTPKILPAAHVCKAWNAKNAGKRAFNHRHGGIYLSGRLLGGLHLAHRVAWALHYGISKFGFVEHIDGNGTNNRITNLRLTTKAQICRNAKKRKDCTSGATGVHWHVGRYGKPHWAARIQYGGKRMFLGSFHDLDDAIACRREAERKFGFGPAHGR